MTQPWSKDTIWVGSNGETTLHTLEKVKGSFYRNVLLVKFLPFREAIWSDFHACLDIGNAPTGLTLCVSISRPID